VEEGIRQELLNQAKERGIPTCEIHETVKVKNWFGIKGWSCVACESGPYLMNIDKKGE
jgi:hypothetical protein